MTLQSTYSRAPGQKESWVEERPFFLKVGRDILFGVYAPPVAPQSTLGIVCVQSGYYVNGAHINQVCVRICQSAARMGIHGLRMEATGTGESTGSVPRRHNELTVGGIAEAANWLRERGATRFVFLGICRSGVHALASVPWIDGASGLVMVSSPIAIIGNRRFELDAWQAPTLRRAIGTALRPSVAWGLVKDGEYRKWALGRARKRLTKTVHRPSKAEAEEPDNDTPLARPAIDALYWTVEHRVPVKLLYGKGDRSYLRIEAGRDDEVGRVVYGAPNVELELNPGLLHGFTTLDGQDWFVSRVESFLASLR